VSPLRFHTRRQPAVTILELLVVLLVTGILVALAFPAGGVVITKTQVTEARVDLRNIHQQAVAASLLQDRELTRAVYEELLVAEAQAAEAQAAEDTGWAAKYSYSATPELPEAFRQLTLSVVEPEDDQVFVLSTLTKRGQLVQVAFSRTYGFIDTVPGASDGDGEGDAPVVISAPEQPVITSTTQVSREAVTVEFSIASSETAPVETVEAWRDNTLVATLATDASTYTFTGLSVGVSYTLEIRVSNTAGSSSASATVTPEAVASTGVLDVGFAAPAPGAIVDPGASSTVRSVAVQDDGKILIGGDFTTYNGVSRNRLARINADGSLDTSFVVGAGSNDTVLSVATQPDGKILIGGEFITYNSVARNRVARLNADGSLDTTFDPGTGANGTVVTVALQPDGKILIGGVFTTYNGTSRNRIARLNADGSLDTSFDPGTGASSNVQAVATQPDGKILIGGQFTTYNGVARNYIARLNSDGSLDTSFVVGTGASNPVSSVAVQGDGKIVIGGLFTTYNGTSRNRVARLNADGSLDTSFVVGTGAGNDVQSVAVQSDGKIVIGGSFTTFDGAARPRFARLNTNGSLDTSFVVGTGASSTVWSVTPQTDGKIVIGGGFTTYNGVARNRIARLNADGSHDTSFTQPPLAGANGTVRSIAVQPDGKTLIVGSFTFYNGVARNFIARLNADGSLDTSFDPGTGANDWVRSVAVQPDGKILIGGNFTSYNGVARTRVARLNADGSLDTSFVVGSGASSTVWSVAVQPDGKILIGGEFSSYNGVARNRIARLNADGSLDTTFLNTGSGASSAVYSVAIQVDGKVVIGGGFTSYNGVTRGRIARLNADGSLDTSFDPGTGANGDWVWSIAVQDDGKIVIAGIFTTYNGVGRNRLARLNADGSLDTSFNPGDSANERTQGVSVQPDGKIVIVGWFTAYRGVSRNGIARLNADGSLDTSFVVGAGTGGASTWVESVAVQPDGKILIGGQFTAYNGAARGRVARLE
jgi:uncharacterized delta-60 repeat protein